MSKRSRRQQLKRRGLFAKKEKPLMVSPTHDGFVLPDEAKEADYIVVIATPMQDQCAAQFCASLCHLVASSVAMTEEELGGTLTLTFLQYGTSVLPTSRQYLAVRALELGATHVLWIDSDMSFPPDMLKRLLAHKQPIVAANCISRRPPFLLTARDKAGEMIYTKPDSTGLEEVDRVGLGVMLHEASILREMRLPWFDFEWQPEKGIFKGEDFVFCDRARKAGFNIYIDHDVSKEVKHVGAFEFSPLYRQAIEDNQERQT